MADFKLFEGTNLEEPDADHRIAMNKPSLAGAFYVRWDTFKNLIRSFTVSKDTDQSISGNKTFTGIVNVQAPTSDNNPVTLKYFNDNAGGDEEIIEVATYANLPIVGDASVLYVVLDENVLYRWSGTVYVSMSSPLSYASQAEMELSEPTENTKVVTPLRAWQGFVYWCKNTLFAELTTTAKTLVGSINEVNDLAKNASSVGGYANNLYFVEAESDIAGYETLSYTPAVLETQENWTVQSSEGEKLFKNYIYPSGVTVNLIPSGLWSFQFYGNISSASGNTNLGMTYFKRSVLGVETDLFTIWSSEINNTAADWIKFSYTYPNFTVDPTDRMGVRVKGRTTHNAPVSIMYVVGDGYGAWLNNPNRIRHSQLRDFNGDLTVQHVDTTTAKATPIDTDKVALWDSVTSKMVVILWTNVKGGLKTYFDTVYTSVASVLLKRDKTETGDAHGFVTPPNDGNFTVSNIGMDYTVGLLANAGAYKINGSDYTNTGLSLTATMVLGQNFMCINSTGQLGICPFDIEDKSKTPVATLYTDGTRYRLSDELHTSGRSLKMHKMEHDTDGARYVSGGTMTFGSSANNNFTFTSAIIRDEDRYHTIGARTQGQMMYRNAGLTWMTLDAPSTYFAKLSTLIPQYDNAGVLTSLGNNNYGITWAYATNCKLPANCEIAFVLGQGVYTSVAQAQAAPQPQLLGATVAEWKLMYRVIYRQIGGALLFTQADDLRTQVTGLVINGGAGLTTLPASQVTVTPPTGYTATNQQSFDDEVALNTLKGNTTAHTLPIAADSLGIWDSVSGVFKRVSLSLIKTFVLTGLSDTAVANTSTNKTGGNLKLVTDGLANLYTKDTAPTIASTPALKLNDRWLDTVSLIEYIYLQDSSGDKFWFNLNVGSVEIPAVASGEKVVTKTSTGVSVAKTLTEMQIAAGTIASANWTTGQATYTGLQGQTTYDTNYKYECIGTNKWIRTALMEARMQLYLTPDVDDSGGAKTSAELNAAYPSAIIGQRVYGMQFEYVKKESLLWKKIACVTA